MCMVVNTSRINPANHDNVIKEELKKVAALIQNEKSKVRVSCLILDHCIGILLIHLPEI